MNDLVSKTPDQLPSTPQGMQDYYRQMAEAYASTEQRAGSTISVKNGIMSLSDQPIPGNQFAAVILDAARLNTYYTAAYNPQATDPPVCYAIGRTDAEMRPHPDMAKAPEFFKAQANQCVGCPHNEFGSGRTGTGKACTNRRRIVMLLAGTYNMTQTGMQMSPFMEASHYESTPFLQMQLPPTSIKGWGEYVRTSAAQFQRPFFGLVTRVYLYPHPTHGKEAIGFEALGPTPPAWDSIIMHRHNDALAEISHGYEPPRAAPHPGGGFYASQEQR